MEKWRQTCCRAGGLCVAPSVSRRADSEASTNCWSYRWPRRHRHVGLQ